MVGGIANTLGNVGPRALQRLQFVVIAIKDDEDFAEDHVDAYNKTTGKQSKVFLLHIVDYDGKAIEIIEAIYSEGLRLLSLHHLKSSRQSTHSSASSGKPSVISSIVADETSVLYMVEAYYSSILAGKSSRLTLILGFRKCSTVKEWATKYPNDAICLHRGTAGAAATIERRQRRLFKQFRIWQCCNPDVSDEKCLEVVDEFLAISIHKFPKGGMRDLRISFDALPAPERSGRLVESMRSMEPGSHVVKVSAGRVEDMHAKHRRKASASAQKQMISTVAAMSVTSGKVEAYKSVARMLLEIEDEKTVQPEAVPQTQIVPYNRKKSAEMLHLYDYVKTHKGSVTDAAVKLAASQELGRLAEHSRTYYSKLAQTTALNKYVARAADTIACHGALVAVPVPVAAAGASSEEPVAALQLVPRPMNAPPVGPAFFSMSLVASSADAICLRERDGIGACMSLIAQQMANCQFKGVKADAPRPIDPALFRAMVMHRVKVPDSLVPFVERYKASTLGGKRGLVQCSKKFLRVSEHIPGRPPHPIPAVVNYDHGCRGLCEQCASPVAIHIFKSLQSGFEAASIGPDKGDAPKFVIARAVILALHVQRPGETSGNVKHVSKDVYVYLADALCSSGGNVAEQLFHHMEIIERVSSDDAKPYNGLVLRYVRDEPVVRARPSPAPFNVADGVIGPVRSSDGFELAAAVGRKECNVVVSTLEVRFHEATRFDTFEVTGLNSSKVITNVIPVPAKATAKAKPKGKAKAKAEPPAADLLGILTGSKSKTGASKQPVDTLVSDLEKILEEAGYGDCEMAEDLRAEARLQEGAELEAEPVPEGEQVAAAASGSSGGGGSASSDVADTRDFAEPWPVYLARLGLQEGLNAHGYCFVFEYLPVGILPSKTAGVIHPMEGNEKNLKATCRVHKDCVCWIKLRGDRSVGGHRLLRDEVEWLSNAWSHNRQDHQQMAFNLKVRHGLKPKTK